MDFQIIIAQNPRHLGSLIAKRFFVYIEEHPEGVVALPTGRTPQLFIQALKQSKFIPDTSRLRFVQLDEYFPIDPRDPSSFCFYVREHYLNLLKIEPSNALTMEGLIGPTLRSHGIETVFPQRLIDFSILLKKPVTEQEKWQKAALEEANEFCLEYEQKIKVWGGIGFFLGGIGEDGHIAFNPPGSSIDSETRLVDLGGKLAATIGLKTICRKADVNALLFAAGDNKAKIIAEAIEQPPSLKVPASVLRTLKNPEFYLTIAAARGLREHRKAYTGSERVHRSGRAVLQVAIQSIDFLYFYPFLQLSEHTIFLSFGVTPESIPEKFLQELLQKIRHDSHAHEIGQKIEDPLIGFRMAALGQDAKGKRYFQELFFFQKLKNRSIADLTLMESYKMLLETQVDRIAALGGASMRDIIHLKVDLGFDPFSPLPQLLEKDIEKVEAHLTRATPELIIIPYMIEESGPTESYRSLQIFGAALKRAKLSIKTMIWEVCSPFYSFGSEDGNLWLPIEPEMLQNLKRVFGDCFDFKNQGLHPFWNGFEKSLAAQENKIFFRESTVKDYLSKLKTLSQGMQWPK